MSDPLSGLRLWVAGARPRTLSAAVVPVAAGTATVLGQGIDPGVSVPWWRSGAALVVALALQVGVNYANDYSDGISGADGAGRVGPLRLVGSGMATPEAVRAAALASFSVAGAAGLVLAVLTGPEVLAAGALCLAAGWTYSGGPKPYAHRGLGELFVFVFFGLVATVGTAYVLLGRVEPIAVAAGAVVGLWAVALLVVNNLRDIEGDASVGKLTLAVRLGDARTRSLYAWLQAGAALGSVAVSLAWNRPAVLALLGSPLAAKAIRSLRSGAGGEDLIGVLATTARIQLVGGLGLAVGLAI